MHSEIRRSCVYNMQAKWCTNCLCHVTSWGKGPLFSAADNGTWNKTDVSSWSNRFMHADVPGLCNNGKNTNLDWCLVSAISGRFLIYWSNGCRETSECVSSNECGGKQICSYTMHNMIADTSRNCRFQDDLRSQMFLYPSTIEDICPAYKKLVHLRIMFTKQTTWSSWWECTRKWMHSLHHFKNVCIEWMNFFPQFEVVSAQQI